MENNLYERVRSFISSNLIVFDEDIEIADDDNIFQMGYVNSLFAMKLLGFVEQEFAIRVPNEEVNIENFSSVNNIVNLIEKKLEVIKD